MVINAKADVIELMIYVSEIRAMSIIMTSCEWMRLETDDRVSGHSEKSTLQMLDKILLTINYIKRIS